MPLIIVDDVMIGVIGVGGGRGINDEQCAYQALTKVLGPQPPLPPNQNANAGAVGRGAYERPASDRAAVDDAGAAPEPRRNRQRRPKGSGMSVVRLVVGACVLMLARPVFAQDWDQYRNLESHFTVSAPGQPTVEMTKWKSEYDSEFPETIYRWKDGPNRYSVSVIDYSDSEAIYTANHHSADFAAPAYWQIDILGSIQYAATQ